MAILTPTRPRGQRTTARRDQASFSATASAWLGHPMADVFLVVVPALLLLGIGTIMVWSASSVFAQVRFGDPYYFLLRQLAFLVIGMGLLAIGWRVPTETLRKLAWPMLILTVIGLLITFLPGVGVDKKGNRNWIAIPGFDMLRLQPSELAKLAVIVWGSAVLVAKQRLLHLKRHLLVPFLPVSLILIGGVVMQKDLGTAMILGMVVLLVLWNVGAPLSVLASILALAALGVAGMVATNASRLARIFGFLDPTSDPTGINYQPLQARFGLASGGWGGLGLGASRQKWGSLSDAHTDFVLAIIGEELGLGGTLLVLALFVTLGYGGFRIALASGTLFGRLLAGGVTSWFMVQGLVNIMVVFGMLPVLGVTLPFVSYGGSSMLANLLGLVVLVACAREEPQAKAWLARRSKSKQPRRGVFAVVPRPRS